MSRNQKVQAVVDAAPERVSTAGQLMVKRAELADAEATLATAEAAMDAQAVMRSRETVAILKEFIARFARAEVMRPDIEEDETGLRRTRRTFAEIAGTPAYEIIVAAGLPDFRPLTDREQEALKNVETERVASQAELRALATEALTEA